MSPFSLAVLALMIPLLDVPVVHEGGTCSLPIREIRVDYSRPWLTRMERAIVSAYESSAYFDYYKDELFAILDSRTDTLLDLNTSILRFFLAKPPHKSCSGFCRTVSDSSQTLR